MKTNKRMMDKTIFPPKWRKLILIMVALPLIQSCASPSDDPNVQQNIEAAENILKDIPELKEEISKNKNKRNAQQLSGTFKGEIDGETFEFTNWIGSNSRISFLDFKGLIYATLNQKPSEMLNIEIMAQKWFEKEFPLDIAPSMYVAENGEYMKIVYTKKDASGNVIQTFQPAEGNMTVTQFNSEKVTISFDGEGFIGDVRLQKRAPLSFEIDLDYNFVTSDARTNQ